MSLPWPAHFLALSPIQSWIASALSPASGLSDQVHLAHVYGAKHRSVIARFTVEARARSAQEVVSKATLESRFFYAPAVDRRDMRAAPENVRERLAAEVVDVPTFGEGLPTNHIAPDAAARDAYLDALRWGTRAQRERTLVLAGRLFSVKDFQQLEVIRESEGFPGLASRWRPLLPPHRAHPLIHPRMTRLTNLSDVLANGHAKNRAPP